MRKTTRLKKLISDKPVLVMPGAYDALSARIIERAGFKAVQCSGYGIAASVLGKPDVGLLSITDMLAQTRNICSAVSIPVMADGDTGFGNVVNVYHTVQAFEAAGAAGINLEDQVFPKRCGHMDGKEVISMEEMIQKIRAAVDAKVDKDFVINARTDAIAVLGIEEAIKRGNAYAAAGADLIFVEAPPAVEDIKYVIKNIKAPVSINMTDGGKTPIATLQELEAWGAARVSIPVTAVFAAAKAVETAMGIILREGISPTANHLVGLPEIKALEQKYGGPAKEKAAVAAKKQG
jgi:methylisocitrate lyase